EQRDRFSNQVPLVLVGGSRESLIGAVPRDLRDLAVLWGGIAADEFHPEEVHALEYSDQRCVRAVAPRKDVGDVAEWFDMTYLQAGLLAHFAHRGVFGAFVLFNVALRQPPRVGSFGANQHEFKSAILKTPVDEAARGNFTSHRQLWARALLTSAWAHQPTSPRLKPSESIRRIALRASADDGLRSPGSFRSHASASSRDCSISR